jgi:hypothetical protein
MKNVNSKRSIGSNIKSILRTTANIPLEATDALVQVTNDLTQVTSATVRGITPFTKGFFKATTNFTVALFNPNATDEELDKILEETTFSNVLESTLQGSGRAGRSTSRAFIEFFEEETETNTNNTPVVK